MNLSALQWTSTAFSICTGLVYAAIFAILRKRKIRADFPFFLAYAAVNVVSNFYLSSFQVMSGAASALYFYSWWGFYTLLILLEFGIMFEVFSYVLKPYSGLVDLGKMMFRWAAVFLFIVAALTALSTAGSGMSRCIAAITLIQRNLSLMQCGLLLLFFFFERRLGLSWRSYPVSLALGLGLSSALSLSLSFITLHVRALPAFEIADCVSTLGIAGFWAYCFGRPQPAGQTVLDSPSRLIFQRWNEALLSTPMMEDKNPALATVDSFLPGIEKTVDRVLARKIAN